MRRGVGVKAPLPRALHSTNGAAVIDGKIYVSGGFYDFQSTRPSYDLYGVGEGRVPYVSSQYRW